MLGCSQFKCVFSSSDQSCLELFDPPDGETLHRWCLSANTPLQTEPLYRQRQRLESACLSPPHPHPKHPSCNPNKRALTIITHILTRTCSRAKATVATFIWTARARTHALAFYMNMVGQREKSIAHVSDIGATRALLLNPHEGV